MPEPDTNKTSLPQLKNITDVDPSDPLEALNTHLQALGEYVEYGHSDLVLTEKPKLPEGQHNTHSKNIDLNTFLDAVQSFYQFKQSQSPLEHKQVENHYMESKPVSRTNPSIEGAYHCLTLLTPSERNVSNKKCARIVLSLIALAEINDPIFFLKTSFWIGKIIQANSLHTIEQQFLIYLQEVGGVNKDSHSIFAKAKLPVCENESLSWEGIEDLSGETMPFFFKQWVQSKYIAKYIKMLFENSVFAHFFNYALIFHTGASYGYFPSFFAYSPGVSFRSSNQLFTKMQQLYQYFHRFAEMYQYNTEGMSENPFWDLLRTSQLYTVLLQFRIFNKHKISDLSEDNLMHLKDYVQFIIRNYTSLPRIQDLSKKTRIELLRNMTKFCISLKTTDFLSKADLHLFFNHLWQEHLGTHIYDLLLLHSNTEQSEIILKQLHSLETFCHTLSNPNFRLKECQTDNSFKDLLISTDTQLTPCFLGFFKAYCPEFLSFILRSLQKNADILRAQNQAIDKTQRSNIQVTYLTLQKIINKLTDQLDNSVRKKPLLALPKRFQEEKGVGLNFFHRPVILLPIQKGSAKPSNQGLVSIQKKIEKSPNYSPSFELRQFFSPPPRILRPSTNYRRTPVPHGFR